MNLAVFYHAAAMPGAEPIIEEQIALLKEWELDTNPITITICGSPESKGWLRDLLLREDIDATLHRAGSNFAEHESPAMFAIEESVKERDGAVLYFHTKGASDPQHTGKRRWRHWMQEKLLKEWRTHLASLEDHDIVGLNWREFWGKPHFSGNFWMARADYLRKLPDFGVYFKASGHDRFACETWLGTGSNPRVLSLVHRDVEYRDAAYFGNETV